MKTDTPKISHPEERPEHLRKAVEAFVYGCPLIPSKDSFCGVAVCGECDATKNFIRKFNETYK
jgi:hypothetical protein